MINNDIKKHQQTTGLIEGLDDNIQLLSIVVIDHCLGLLLLK